ncbi:hypothetical protein [Nonomuraea longicatena]|uniref:Secreted protein n=1 Tax=Nonomuraea longicatena TaxID=83682 RepID=A0ABP4BAL3_9ACTN
MRKAMTVALAALTLLTTQFTPSYALSPPAEPSPSPPSAAAATLPGGKDNFVVSQGNLRDGSRANWVRLGTYVFNGNGTVNASMYLWKQTEHKARTQTNVEPDTSCATDSLTSTANVRRCKVLTANGFSGTAPGDAAGGTFILAGDTVTITWTTGRTGNETWQVVPSADGKLVRLNFQTSSFATHGYAYGSTATLATRRAMSTVQQHPATLKQDLAGWNSDKVTQSAGQTFTHQVFKTCAQTTHCLTYLQKNSTSACKGSSGCPNYGGGTPANVTSIQYYLAKLSSFDRRDTLWHWCTCLAMERSNEKCYTGNSHVKPMYQIIDDSGNFHGWVGVEASYYATGGEVNRPRDMISVFRIADFR